MHIEMHLNHRIHDVILHIPRILNILVLLVLVWLFADHRAVSAYASFTYFHFTKFKSDSLPFMLPGCRSALKAQR